VSLQCGVVDDDDDCIAGIGIEMDGEGTKGRRDTSRTVYYRCGLITENLLGEQNEMRQSSRAPPQL